LMVKVSQPAIKGFIAYSGAKLPPIPFYCYHRFRCIVTTHSGTL
jgi:hypothetical protein